MSRVSGIEISSSQGLKNLQKWAQGKKSFPPKGRRLAVGKLFPSQGLILRVFLTCGMKKFLYLKPTAFSENLFESICHTVQIGTRDINCI